MLIGALPIRSVKSHVKKKKKKIEMFSSFKDSTFMTRIHASNHAKKNCTTRKCLSFMDSTFEF